MFTSKLLEEFTNEYLPKKQPVVFAKARKGNFYAFPQDDGSLNIGVGESECTPEEIDIINEAWDEFYRSKL